SACSALARRAGSPSAERAAEPRGEAARRPGRHPLRPDEIPAARREAPLVAVLAGEEVVQGRPLPGRAADRQHMRDQAGLALPVRRRPVEPALIGADMPVAAEVVEV